jgi:hypothetical protein
LGELNKGKDVFSWRPKLVILKVSHVIVFSIAVGFTAPDMAR